MADKLKRLIYYWLPAIFCGIFIFSISSVPGNNIPSLFPLQDIAFHASIFGIFSFFISRLVKVYKPKKSKAYRLVFVLLFIFIFALTDEFHQSFVPNRTASIVDVLTDCAGSLIGALFYL